MQYYCINFKIITIKEKEGESEERERGKEANEE